MRTIDYRPLWTLRRLHSHAAVSCEVSVLLDDALDVPHYAVRVMLNREPVYECMFTRRADAEAICADALADLKAAGWRDDVAWMLTTDAPTRAA